MGQRVPSHRVELPRSGLGPGPSVCSDLLEACGRSEPGSRGISSNPLWATGGENYADMPRAATPAD